MTVLTCASAHAYVPGMSSAPGLAFFADGEVQFFWYDGTSDIVCPTLFRTANEQRAGYKVAPWPAECRCPGLDEPALLCHDYGHRTSWWGRACRKCSRITSPLDFFEEIRDTVTFVDLPPGLWDWVWEQPADMPVQIPRPMRIRLGEGA